LLKVCAEEEKGMERFTEPGEINSKEWIRLAVVGEEREERVDRAR
jgi:hypothetical protein